MPTTPDDTQLTGDGGGTFGRRPSPLASSIAGAVMGTPLGYFARIWLGIFGGGHLPVGAGYGLLYGLAAGFIVGVVRRCLDSRRTPGHT